MSNKEFKVVLKQRPDLYDFVIKESNARGRSYNDIIIGALHCAKLSNELFKNKKNAPKEGGRL